MYGPEGRRVARGRGGSSRPGKALPIVLFGPALGVRTRPCAVRRSSPAMPCLPHRAMRQERHVAQLAAFIPSLPPFPFPPLQRPLLRRLLLLLLSNTMPLQATVGSPGRPCRALKHRDVSSTMTAPFTCER